MPSERSHFGPMTLPIEESTVATQLGDPALYELGQFLMAAINDGGTAAWSSVMPGVEACRAVFYSNPEEIDFNEKFLPCAFVWRSDDNNDRMADDYEQVTSTIRLMWVFPTAIQAMQAKRSSFTNAVWRAVTLAVLRGRTPGWRMHCDTDPRSVTEGSFLGSYLQEARLITKSKRDGAMVEVIADGKRSYFALQGDLELREVLTEGTEFTAPTAVRIDVNELVHDQEP